MHLDPVSSPNSRQMPGDRPSPLRRKACCVLKLVAGLMLMLASHLHATILTFEDLSANNLNMNAIANPFGTGQYGSRAASAINAGFQAGTGFTPNVALTWGSGWHTYVGWPFGNDAQTAAGKVAQADFGESGGAPLLLTFTPEAGFGVQVNSFAFTVWDSSPALPVQISWAVFAGSVAPENQIVAGTSLAIGAVGGAQTISTGLTNVQSSGRPVILRWQLVSGDPTYLAINNVNFSQGPAKFAPILTWPRPDAIIVGTPLTSAQLNAQSDVPGSFTYTPAAGDVLAAGLRTLSADFVPANTATHDNGRVMTTLLVKSNSTPVVQLAPPLKIGANAPLSVAMFRPVTDVRGNFVLSPPAGTFLGLGSQAVTLTFTPENPVFESVTTSVVITVVSVVPEGTVWTFDDPSDRLRPLCGESVLTYYDPLGTGWAATKMSFGSASSFGLPLPMGGDPQVMRFTHTNVSEGLRLAYSDAPNGVYQPNGWLANYTILLDLFLPTVGTTSYRPLYNANIQNANSAEATITATAPGTLASLGRGFGEIRSNTWHRVAIVVRAAPAEGQIHLYIDGAFLGAIGSNDSLISSGHALETALLLLTDNLGNRGTGYLGALRFIGRNLDYAEVKALGGVHANGPHVSGPPAPRPPFQPLRDVVIIGHRGNGGLAPEDTLPSFLSTFALGGDVVEVDIRQTADGRVVAMHDSTVDRTTDGTGSVANMTLAEIQALDAGSWFSPVFAGTPPPALREIMAAVKDAYPNAILYLDCKLNGLAPLIRADCDATGFPPERLWFWVYEQVAEAAAYRAVFPSGKLIWGENNWASGGSIGGWPSLNVNQRAAVVSGMIARGVYGYDFGDNEANVLNSTTIQELRAAGFFVSLYSTLHPASMTRAINNIGIDGMETDFPGVLRELMPNYAATAAATPASARTVSVNWTAFPASPAVSEIRLRGKRKATAAWTTMATNIPARGRVALPTNLVASTLYEFQPIAYAAGVPVAFGSVTEATTLVATATFNDAYTAWRSAHRPVGVFNADDDGDGVFNIVEYAQDLDPLVPGPTRAAGPFSFGAGEFRFRYQRRANAFVRWTCESSTNLAQWTPLLEFADYSEAVISSAGGLETVEVTFGNPPEAERWFARLRAQPMP